MHKNIIFDFGNVFVKWDPDYMASLYSKNEEEKELLMEYLFKNWGLLDNGSISDEDFIAMVNANLPVSMHHIVAEYMKTWVDNLPRIESTCKLAKKLKEKGHHIYLLTNMPTSCSYRYKEFEVLSIFDGYVFSAEIKMVKPEARIYKHILEKYHLDPATCLFVDDLAPNIEGARSVGIESYQYDYNKIDEFISYLRQNNDL